MTVAVLRRSLALVALVAGLTTACGTTEPAPSPLTATPPASVAPSSSQPDSEEPDTVTTIRITVGDQSFSGRLADNPTARDLAAQLPLTLGIRDFNGVEKIAGLPRALTMEGVPAGDDPEINDIGYYAPSNDLVFYYGEVGYFDGIVRIGRVAGQDMELLEQQRDGSQVRVERA